VLLLLLVTKTDPITFHYWWTSLNGIASVAVGVTAAATAIGAAIASKAIDNVRLSSAVHGFGHTNHVHASLSD
jgi:hypothetical protein